MKVLRSRDARAFTLVEIMVSMAILTAIMVILMSITDHVSRTWRYTNARIEEFRAARTAFEAITRHLSQTTLNTYWDYLDKNGNGRNNTNSATFVPNHYGRQSELRFITGQTQTLTADTTWPRPLHGVFFQAPLGYADTNAATLDLAGLENLLNTWGYFVEFNSDETWMPGFLQGKIKEHYRYRLMELMQPSNALTIYNYTSGNSAYYGTDWFSVAFTPPASRPVHILAENVVALVILPKLTPADEANGGFTDASLAPNYFYSSTGKDLTGAPLPTVSNKSLNPTNQLPPVVQVTMVAMDEASANRLETMNRTTMPDLGMGTLFQQVGSLEDASQPGYAQDLQTLQNTLAGKKVNFRVFSTNVSIRGAKWSTAE
jgi:uncharacterized protein (TIGR02599 family)